MNTLQIDIKNPKATKLLKSLEDLDLISIRKVKNEEFLNLLKKIRAKAKNNTPSLNEITKEVEIVRSSRYAKSKR